MLSTRIISGLIFAILFLLGLFHPAFGWVLPIIVAAAAMMGVAEFMRFGVQKPPAIFRLLAMAATVALLADAFYFELDHALLIIGMLAILSLGAGMARLYTHVAEAAGISLAGTIYVALPLALAIVIWRRPMQAGIQDAPHYLIFLILTTWSSDTGAFFTGRLIGKHKLAPKLSPGKTWEGFFGGIVLTVLVACSIKLFWNNIDRIFQWWEVIVLAVLFSVIGPIGDLAESWLKRSAGIKDSGQTFTGHGGMLDIIDSLLFTSVVYYGYLWIFHQNVIGHVPRAAVEQVTHLARAIYL